MNKQTPLLSLTLSMLLLSTASIAAVPPIPVPVDRDSDGLIEINSLDDLNEMRNDLRGTSLRGNTVGCPASTGCVGYELTRELNFDTNGDGSVDDADWNMGANWIPVGTGSTPFAARFNGNGHSIINLRIVIARGVINYGLFGSVSDVGAIKSPYIKFVRLITPVVVVNGMPDTQANSIGTLAGSVINAAIEGCDVEQGIMEANSTADVGGLIAIVNNTTVSNSSYDGTINNSSAPYSNSVGGLIGRVQSQSSVLQSFARGSVIGKTAGGLVDILNDSNIAESYANMHVTAHGDKSKSAGGLVNRAQFATPNSAGYSIRNSYALGTVDVDSTVGGGLIADLYIESNAFSLEASFAKNIIYGHGDNSSRWSNLIQKLFLSSTASMSIIQSYWVTNVGGPTLGNNGSDLTAGGKTLAKLQCANNPQDNGCPEPMIFSNWSTTAWNFGNRTELPALNLSRTSIWMNADTPNTDTGDDESFSNLIVGFPSQICANPLALHAKVTNSGYVFTAETPEVFDYFRANKGLACTNAKQADGQCDNYKVKYLCDETAAYQSVRWTEWSNKDSPYGDNGDYEKLPTDKPTCAASGPIGIQGHSVDGDASFYGPAQKLNALSLTQGLKCLNSDNTCSDYEVRMKCAVTGDR